MNEDEYRNSMVGVELFNTAVSAADSKAARKHATEEAAKSRDWQEKMYDRQLDDQIAWRTHQEQYNSPEAQMQRYRDAGINPMYAISGNGSNTVITPSSASVPMTNKADTPSPRNLRFDSNVLSQSLITKAQVKAIEAQANMYNAQANEANTRAAGIGFENEGKEIEALINRELKNYTLSHPVHDADEASYIKFKANAIAQAEEFQFAFNQLGFWDARKKFMHLDAVRKFERDLQNHERSKFEHELSQCRSAAEIFKVSAKWAIPNQWINASSEVLGAALSLFGAFKGTKMMPTYSRNFTESYGDHTSTTYNYNNNLPNL